MADPILERLAKETQGWPAGACVSQEELVNVLEFLVFVTNRLDSQDLSYRGFSYKTSDWLGVLVVKVKDEEGGYVCFVNGRTLIECMVIFLRKLREDRVDWRVDKFF